MGYPRHFIEYLTGRSERVEEHRHREKQVQVLGELALGAQVRLAEAAERLLQNPDYQTVQAAAEQYYQQQDERVRDNVPHGEDAGRALCWLNGFRAYYNWIQSMIQDGVTAREALRLKEEKPKK